MSKLCFHCMAPVTQETKTCPKCGKSIQYEAPAHHLKPGTCLQGRYLIGKALGQGGFGITYIGFDTTLNMRVAIKEYYPNGYSNRNHEVTDNVTITASDEDGFFRNGKQKFLTEARTLAKFSGEPGIVDVRDFFDTNNTAYIVMSYVDGITLKKYVADNGRIAPEILFGAMRPIMSALEKVHRQGVIHRDISPDNIMVLPDGSLKLLDFGAAREIGGDKSLSVMLKPGYAPEEQYRSGGHQGPWTDVYALCATMYYCLVGKAPEESIDRIWNGNQNTPVPSSSGVKMLPNQEAAIMRGLSVKAEDRYPSISDLSDVLYATDDAQEQHSYTIFSDNDKTVCDGQFDLPKTNSENQSEFDNRTAGFTSREEKTNKAYHKDNYSNGQPARSNFNSEDEVKREEDKGRTGRKGIVIALVVLLLVAAAIVIILLTFRGRGSGNSAVVDPSVETAIERTDLQSSIESQTIVIETAPVSTAAPAPSIDSSPMPTPSAMTTEDDTFQNSGLTREILNTTLDDFEKIELSSATASSELNAGGILFAAGYAIDADMNRPWTEGANDSGIGESLTVYLSSPQPVRLISLRLGYAKSSELFYENTRPSKLRISFSDGSNVDCSFEDVNAEQYVYLNKAVNTSFIKLTILDVFLSTDNDTCIYLVSAYKEKTGNAAESHSSASASSWGEWSDWSTIPISASASRQVETRKSPESYKMVHYGTQEAEPPYWRVFRDFSINGEYWKYGARESYGEKHLERTVSPEMLDSAIVYNTGEFIAGEYQGYQRGNGTAYFFGDDKYVWFIERIVGGITEYRYRDLSP